MSTIAATTETDARLVWDTTRETGIDTIAELAEHTNLDSKYVRSLLVDLDKRGLLAFTPDQTEQFQGYHWDEDDDAVFENFWNEGHVTVSTIEVATPAVSVTGTCRCGCGAAVAGKRIYRPGHDARHASQVAKAIAAGGSSDLINDLPTNALQVKASNQVGRILARNAKKALAPSNRRGGTTKPASAKPEAKPETIEGVVKIGRWTYPAIQHPDGGVERNSKRDGSGIWIVVPEPFEFEAN